MKRSWLPSDVGKRVPDQDPLAALNIIVDDLDELVEEEHLSNLLVDNIRSRIKSLGDKASVSANHMKEKWSLYNPKKFFAKLLFTISDASPILPKSQESTDEEWRLANRKKMKELLASTVFNSLQYIFSASNDDERERRAQELGEAQIIACVCLVAYVQFSKNYLHVPADLSFYMDLKHKSANELTAEQISFMKRLYSNNYAAYDNYKHLLGDKLKEQLTSSTGEFMFLNSWNEKPIGFLFVEQKGNILELGALNLLPPLQAMGLVEPFIIVTIRDLLSKYNNFEWLSFSVVAGSKAEHIYKKHFYAVEVPDSQMALEDNGEIITRHRMRIARKDLERLTSAEAVS